MATECSCSIFREILGRNDQFRKTRIRYTIIRHNIKTICAVFCRFIPNWTLSAFQRWHCCWLPFVFHLGVKSLSLTKWFKTHRFYLCLFRFEWKIEKLKIIKFFCLVIRIVFAANWIDLPVMCKCLGQKWQNHNFEDKTVLKKSFFTRF